MSSQHKSTRSVMDMVNQIEEMIKARATVSRHNLRVRANTVRSQKSPHLSRLGSLGTVDTLNPPLPSTADAGSTSDISAVAHANTTVADFASEFDGRTITTTATSPRDHLKRSQQHQSLLSVRTTGTDDTSTQLGGANVFWYTGLAQALETENDDDINREILRNFLNDHDPLRLDQVDAMLEEYKGRVDVLFEQLQREYPGDNQSAVSFCSLVRKDSMSTQAEAGMERLPSFATPTSGESPSLRGHDVPTEVGPFVDLDGGNLTNYILSAVSVRAKNAKGPRRKWALNLEDNILKRRMIKAGASREEVDALMSGMSKNQTL